MWSVLGTLISGFLLIRDFFGYLLPGAVLFGCLALSIDVQRFVHDNFGTADWLPRSEWAIAAAVVGACYALGQLLASAGYLVLDGIAWIERKHEEKKKARDRKQIETKEERAARQRKLTADSLYFRFRYPSLFIELDRRDTIAVFRTGLTMALFGSVALLPDFWLRAGTFIAATVMLWVSARARCHVEGFTEDTIAAGVMAAEAKMPPERRGVSDAKPPAEEESAAAEAKPKG